MYFENNTLKNHIAMNNHNDNIAIMVVVLMVQPCTHLEANSYAPASSLGSSDQEDVGGHADHHPGHGDHRGL